jgi:hypothetical protein
MNTAVCYASGPNGAARTKKETHGPPLSKVQPFGCTSKSITPIKCVLFIYTCILAHLLAGRIEQYATKVVRTLPRYLALLAVIANVVTEPLHCFHTWENL